MSFPCPKCGSDARTFTTRLKKNPVTFIKRVRVCASCKKRIQTQETLLEGEPNRRKGRPPKSPLTGEPQVTLSEVDYAAILKGLKVLTDVLSKHAHPT